MMTLAPNENGFSAFPGSSVSGAIWDLSVPDPVMQSGGSLLPPLFRYMLRYTSSLFSLLTDDPGSLQSAVLLGLYVPVIPLNSDSPASPAAQSDSWNTAVFDDPGETAIPAVPVLFSGGWSF